MLKELIDIGLTAANVLSLYNDNKPEDETDRRRDQQNRRETRRNIANFRNTAYIVHRLLK